MTDSAKQPCELAVAYGSALALVEAGPMKTERWMEKASAMCRYCRKGEDVDQAAARILAIVAQQLRTALEHFYEVTADPAKHGRYLTAQDREIIREVLNNSAPSTFDFTTGS
jgi:hypothetical protein